MFHFILLLTAGLSTWAKPPRCVAALIQFPETHSRRYASGFHPAQQKAYDFKTSLQKLEVLSIGLRQLKTIELVERLHEISFIRRQIVLAKHEWEGKEFQYLERTHVEWAHVADRAVAQLARSSSASLRPYFDELRAIVGDLNHWYPHGQSMVTILTILAGMTQNSGELSGFHVAIIKRLTDELADLGPQLTRAQTENLIRFTKRRLELEASSDPKRRAEILTDLIAAQMERLRVRKLPFASGRDYLEFLIDQLHGVNVIPIRKTGVPARLVGVLRALLDRALNGRDYISHEHEKQILEFGQRLALPLRRDAQ